MITAVILTVTFLASALIGIQVLMRAGMNRERERFLSNEPPTWISAIARIISGLHVHMPDRPARADLSPNQGGLRVVSRPRDATAAPERTEVPSDPLGRPERSRRG